MARPTRMAEELGVTTLLRAGKDVQILLFTRFIRMFAYGSSTLILALLFTELGYTDFKIGVFMTLTLAGDVLISLALTFVADGLGRRKILVVGAVSMTISGVIFASVQDYWVMLFAAVIGVVSPGGNEIGPFRAIEESIIAHLSNDEVRPHIFAWYVVFGTLGASLGSFSCGWVTQGLQSVGWTRINSYKLIFWTYSGVGLVKAWCSFVLSPGCEIESPPRHTHQNPRAAAEEQEPFLHQGVSTAKRQPTNSSVSQISRQSRITLAKLCSIFFFDSLASGMVPYSFLSLFLERKFLLPGGQLGSMVSGAQLVASIGNIFASSLAKRIGLVRAMVYTHLPSAILLMLIPVPQSKLLTIIILVLRASLASMDQAPRTAFLAAIVLPNERTAVMGVVNTVKTLSQTSGPFITGGLANSQHFWVAFVMAGALKASYDVAMLVMFLNIRLRGEPNQQYLARTDVARELELGGTGTADSVEAAESSTRT